MGVSSNSQIFLSENGTILLRPAMEIHDQVCCQTSIIREDHELRTKRESMQELDREEEKDEEEEEEDEEEDHDEEKQQHNNNNIIVQVPVTPLKGLKLEVPTKSYMDMDEERSEKKDDSDDDGFKTPTSADHKIPPMLQCPPAPNPKLRRQSKKRKSCRPRTVLDVYQELQSLLPTQVVVDLGGGGKNKKVKRCSGNENRPDSKFWQWRRDP